MNWMDDGKDKSGCGCGCGCGDDGCGDGHEEACGCGSEGAGEGIITMTDTETGEEFTFAVEDMFELEDEVYYVLVSCDDDPEMVIVRVVEMEDGSQGLQSLEDEEAERVYAEYERLCEEDEGGDDDEDEDRPEAE